MARTPVRLAGPAQVSNSAATKYTVPGSTIAVVRHIQVYNPGTGTVNFTLSIGTDAAGTRLFDAYPILEDVPLVHYCYHVLAAAEIIQALGSVNNQLVLTISGDEYPA
jgi:hypothetical protein